MKEKGIIDDDFKFFCHHLHHPLLSPPIADRGYLYCLHIYFSPSHIIILKGRGSSIYRPNLNQKNREAIFSTIIHYSLLIIHFHWTSSGFKCQIRLLYSVMVLSEEKPAEQAVFMIALCSHLSLSV